MQPFDSFTLDRFRGLSGLTLEGLGRINVLVGANNSGKSSILEALELACDPLSVWKWIAIADQRDSRSNAIDRIDNLLWLFPYEPGSSDVHAAIKLRFSGAIQLLGLEANPHLNATTSDEVDEYVLEDVDHDVQVYGTRRRTLSTDAIRGMRRVLNVAVNTTPTQPEMPFGPILMFTVIEGERVVGEKPDKGSFRTPCASIAPLSHRTRSIHAERLSQAKESGLVGDAVALLQQFDPEIQDLDILARQGTFADLRIRHKTLGLAPLNAFGDGMRRALLYALTLPQVRGGVLLIDEIESAIHVKALGGVFTWLTRACEQFAVQLFASTHSLEALESLLGDDEHAASQVVGYHLPNRSTGGAVMRYEGELLARLIRDRGLDVR